MYSNKSFAAIIPARSGSVSVKIKIYKRFLENRYFKLL